MMNAKELHRLMVAGRIVLADPTTGHHHMPTDQEIAHRALSLLAAAEANDGTTPETDAEAFDAIRIAVGRTIDLSVVSADFARLLERERNGLALAHADALEELDAALSAAKAEAEVADLWREKAKRAEAELAKLRQHAEAMALNDYRADFPKED